MYDVLYDRKYHMKSYTNGPTTQNLPDRKNKSK